MNALAKLDKATTMLAEAKTLEEVKHILDIAEAARTYARAAKLGLEAYNHAAEVKVRAERKAGEMLNRLEGAQGKRRDLTSYQPDTKLSKKEVLEEQNIPHASAQLANMPGHRPNKDANLHTSLVSRTSSLILEEEAAQAFSRLLDRQISKIKR